MFTSLRTPWLAKRQIFDIIKGKRVTPFFRAGHEVRVLDRNSLFRALFGKLQLHQCSKEP